MLRWLSGLRSLTPIERLDGAGGRTSRNLVRGGEKRIPCVHACESRQTRDWRVSGDICGEHADEVASFVEHCATRVTWADRGVRDERSSLDRKDPAAPPRQVDGVAGVRTAAKAKEHDRIVCSRGSVGPEALDGHAGKRAREHEDRKGSTDRRVAAGGCNDGAHGDFAHGQRAATDLDTDAFGGKVAFEEPAALIALCDAAMGSEHEILSDERTATDDVANAPDAYKRIPG